MIEKSKKKKKLLDDGNCNNRITTAAETTTTITKPYTDVITNVVKRNQMKETRMRRNSYVQGNRTSCKDMRSKV